MKEAWIPHIIWRISHMMRMSKFWAMSCWRSHHCWKMWRMALLQGRKSRMMMMMMVRVMIVVVRFCRVLHSNMAMLHRSVACRAYRRVQRMLGTIGWSWDRARSPIRVETIFDGRGRRCHCCSRCWHGDSAFYARGSWMREYISRRIAGFMAMLSVFVTGMYICRMTLANGRAHLRFSFSFLNCIRKEITCPIYDTPVRGCETHCNVSEP